MGSNLRRWGKYDGGADEHAEDLAASPPQLTPTWPHGKVKARITFLFHGTNRIETFDKKK
jgi:hypothetical protein